MMCEGGYLAWKRQEVNLHRGPPGSYEHLHRPLPPPPSDMEWVHNKETREWRLEPLVQRSVSVEQETQVVVLEGVIADTNDGPYLEHLVQPCDTLQGICLRYGVTATELRQANGAFSGGNLSLAPNPLLIPCKSSLPSGQVLLVEQAFEPDVMIDKMRSAVKDLSVSEARAYLDLNDWNLQGAIANAQEDGN